MPTAQPYGLIATFETAPSLYHAAEAVRDAGYRHWDCITPFPVHGLDKAMGLRRSIVPRISLAGGITGFITGMSMIWWTGAVDYKLIVGGKPLFSPMFAFPVSYELTILFTAFATIIGMFVVNGLPMHYHPVLKYDHIRRGMDDTFFIVIEARDPRFNLANTKALLEKAGGKAVTELEASAMRNVYLATFFVCVLLVSILGFRDTPFTKPPIDLFPDWAFPGMEVQPKLRPQSESKFFADGRADRTPPARTVARGMLRDDDHLHFGKTAAGAFATTMPASLPVDLKFLERGRDRFQIYCSPCHGALGDGNGMTKRYGMGATPSYHDPRLRTMADGEIFNTITMGKNTMLPYADKITPEDRWAVVTYIRALQRAQQGTVADVSDAAGKKALGLP